MLQSQDPPQTGNAFASSKVSSPQPSLLSGEICVHPTEVSPPAATNQRAASKARSQWGLSSLSGQHLGPIVSQVGGSFQLSYLHKELSNGDSEFMFPMNPNQGGRCRGLVHLTCSPALNHKGVISEKGFPTAPSEGWL